MSKFMEFLNNIDNDIINETYVDSIEEEEQEPLVEMPIMKKKVKVRSNTIKKDSSVKLIESRIRTKLDDIGLNESAISEVVSFVLNDVQKVTEVKEHTQPKSKPIHKKNVQEHRMTTIVGRAESLLEGLPESPTMGSIPSSGDGEIIEESNMSDVTNIASSLL